MLKLWHVYLVSKQDGNVVNEMLVAAKDEINAEFQAVTEFCELLDIEPPMYDLEVYEVRSVGKYKVKLVEEEKFSETLAY